MSFTHISGQSHVIQLLQRSLEQGRLGHAYLFTGDQMDDLEAVARNLAKTVNCQNPPRRGTAGRAVDCCDACLSCRKIDGDTHADVRWIRPESKIRAILIDQMRDLLQAVYLKPTEAEHKVMVIVGADRMNERAANAFLKTLEEPPSDSVFILLSTEPQRMLETILSRCLRLSFAVGAGLHVDERSVAWLDQFARMAATEGRGLLGRYRLLGTLARHLAARREEIEKELAARSPIEKYEDADADLVEKWEGELAAAVESEYRRQRAELLLACEWWLRDVWLQALGTGETLLSFPQLAASTQAVAARLKPAEAMENLTFVERTQRLLHTNAQEALVLEVGLLKLRL
jgi:DNA polymerase-3 subunit delta'